MEFYEYDAKNVAAEFAKVVHVTDKALLIEIDGKEMWFPKSQISLPEPSADLITGNSEKGFEGTLVISKWLAGEKGFL